MTITIENADENILSIIKSLKKLSPKIKVKRKKNSLEKAVNDLESGNFEIFHNFDEYKKAMDNL